MKTVRVSVKSGRFVDMYALGIIDATHLYFKRYEGEVPTLSQIETGHVYHVAQLNGIADGFYSSVWSWMQGATSTEELQDRQFVAE
jgi:hypothetical protein